MSEHPFVFLQQQPALAVGIIGFVFKGGVGAPRQNNNILKALVAATARGEMQGGLIHFNRRALGNIKHPFIPDIKSVFADLPGVPQNKHKIGNRNVYFRALMVFKAVIGGVFAVAIACLNGHFAVKHIFNVFKHAELLKG